MTSEKQIAANRRNAKLATGPKSVLGKIISCMNAYKHGRYSETARKFREALKRSSKRKAPILTKREQQAIDAGWRRVRILHGKAYAWIPPGAYLAEPLPPIREDE